MSKHILIIAFHYPPISVSSGVHRTAKFTQYLPEYGWHPDVLTVNPRAYIRTAESLPAPLVDTTITRAFALDTARHLAIMGRYPKFLALPDRWISWWFGAIPVGLKLIRQNRPKVIWFTYPIATAHLIAYTLHRITGIPWVADLRDPMTDVNYPPDKLTKACFKWIEAKTLQHCSHAVFTTPDTLSLYAARYPQIARDRLHVIANGFDEDTFARIEQALPVHNQQQPHKPFKLVHSGILYQSERNPEPFFNAIANLKQKGVLSKEMLNIILRASGSEEYYQPRLKSLGIDDIVSLESALPYDDALIEMLDADGLLLFQAANCNHQIPAKAYEYFRARRPIFALTDQHGNTAALLKEANINTIVNIESSDDIATGLVQFLHLIEQGTAPVAADAVIQSHSRKQRTVELVKILDSIE